MSKGASAFRSRYREQFAAFIDASGDKTVTPVAVRSEDEQSGTVTGTAGGSGARRCRVFVWSRWIAAPGNAGTGEEHAWGDVLAAA